MTDLHITLFNFDIEELKEKTELIIKHGGHSVSLFAQNTTHLVVKNNSNYRDILENYTILPKYIVSEKV